MPSDLVHEYMRIDHLPQIWCPGCGNGVIMRDVAVAIQELIDDSDYDFDRDDFVIVSGIGCSSRAAGYLDFNSIHTTHGRAIAFATGIKMANPKLHVVVLTGDGDCSAIGGNHLIHAARRNLGLTVICFNNDIYGMTGGQYSPMTPKGSKATTAPYLTIEPSFNLLDLAKAAGATFCARATTFHVPLMVDVIAKGIAHKGFSIIECVSACPINFGRQNKAGAPAQMMEWQRDHGVMVAAWNKMDPEKKAEAIAAGKFPIGVLYETNEVQEYTEAYDEIIRRAQGGK